MKDGRKRRDACEMRSRRNGYVRLSASSNSFPSRVKSSSSIVAMSKREDVNAPTPDDNKRFKSLLDESVDEFLCPIGMALPVDPVTAEDGQIYERAHIEEWIAKGNGKSPLHNTPMGPVLLPAPRVKSMVRRLVDSGAVTGEKTDAVKEQLAQEKHVVEMREKAEDGVAWAMFNMGVMYLCGSKGQPKNAEEAFRWFQRSASGEYPDGYALLGCCYRRGQGVDKDEMRGIINTGVAAGRGSMNGCCDLGAYSQLLSARGSPPYENERAATFWYRKMQKCSADSVHPSKHDTIRTWLLENAEEESVAETRKMAHGNPEAMFDMGLMYLSGGLKGLPKKEEEAFRWFERCADADFPNGYALLGFCYLRGLGVGKDEMRGLMNIGVAAGRGSMHGCFQLAQIFAESSYEDAVEHAIKWYRRMKTCTVDRENSKAYEEALDIIGGGRIDMLGIDEWLLKHDMEHDAAPLSGAPGTSGVVKPFDYDNPTLFVCHWNESGFRGVYRNPGTRLQSKTWKAFLPMCEGTGSERKYSQQHLGYFSSVEAAARCVAVAAHDTRLAEKPGEGGPKVVDLPPSRMRPLLDAAKQGGGLDVGKLFQQLRIEDIEDGRKEVLELPKSMSSASGFVGVHKAIYSDKWQTQVCWDGNLYNCGVYCDSPEQCARVYSACTELMTKLHASGEITYTRF